MGALKIKPRVKAAKIRRKAFKMFRAAVKSPAHLEQILSTVPDDLMRARMRKELAPALKFKVDGPR